MKTNLKQYKQIKNWQSKHKDQYKAQTRKAEIKHFHSTKKIVIDHYSNGQSKCIMCGIGDIRVLSIDHISGNGHQQRKSQNIACGYQSYKFLIKENFPDGFQVLCLNCQRIKQIENHEFGSKLSLD